MHEASVETTPPMQSEETAMNQRNTLLSIDEGKHTLSLTMLLSQMPELLKFKGCQRAAVSCHLAPQATFLREYNWSDTNQISGKLSARNALQQLKSACCNLRLWRSCRRTGINRSFIQLCSFVHSSLHSPKLPATYSRQEL